MNQAGEQQGVIVLHDAMPRNHGKLPCRKAPMILVRKF